MASGFSGFSQVSQDPVYLTTDQEVGGSNPSGRATEIPVLTGGFPWKRRQAFDRAAYLPPIEAPSGDQAFDCLALHGWEYPSCRCRV